MSRHIHVDLSPLDGVRLVTVSIDVSSRRSDILARLKVPERFRAGIIRTASMSKDQFVQLVEALEKAPSCENSQELVALIKDETPALSEQDRSEVISALTSMLSVQRNAHVSPERFADDVWESLSADVPRSVQSLDQVTFRNRISTLVDLSSLDVASIRILDVKRAVERNFCKVQVLTDIRPVFKENLSETPSEVAVIHHFQIGYHDGMAKHQEFYVSLDGRDLELLKKAIAEAEIKASTLERMMGVSGVRLHK